MERVNLFRGRRYDTKEWIYGSLVGDVILGEIVTLDEDLVEFEEWCSIIPETVGQFIGRKDINKVKIFEGDKVSFDGNITADDSFGLEPNGFVYDEDSIYTVIWNNDLAGWDLDFEEGVSNKFKYHTRNLLLSGNCEIIK